MSLFSFSDPSLCSVYSITCWSVYFGVGFGSLVLFLNCSTAWVGENCSHLLDPYWILVGKVTFIGTSNGWAVWLHLKRRLWLPFRISWHGTSLYSKGKQQRNNIIRWENMFSKSQGALEELIFLILWHTHHWSLYINYSDVKKITAVNMKGVCSNNHNKPILLN